jgi:hypothetical protein
VREERQRERERQRGREAERQREREAERESRCVWTGHAMKPTKCEEGNRKRAAARRRAKRAATMRVR